MLKKGLNLVFLAGLLLHGLPVLAITPPPKPGQPVAVRRGQHRGQGSDLQEDASIGGYAVGERRGSGLGSPGGGAAQADRGDRRQHRSERQTREAHEHSKG